MFATQRHAYPVGSDAQPHSTSTNMMSHISVGQVVKTFRCTDRCSGCCIVAVSGWTCPSPPRVNTDVGVLGWTCCSIASHTSHCVNFRNNTDYIYIFSHIFLNLLPCDSDSNLRDERTPKSTSVVASLKLWNKTHTSTRPRL